MEIKDINLEEYEISEQKDKEIIVLKKKKSKFPTWEDLGNISGVFIGAGSEFFEDSCIPTSNSNRNVFLTEKHAKSALAMAQISQLIPYYGGKIANDEWKDSSIRKYIIFRKMSYVGRCEAYSNYEFLAFHTAEQRDEFLKNNEQLVKDYLMIE
nr:MAG TPA: hypothetical protein [Bacteriophage sp.]